MNLSHLKYFISLADSKHFANTAKQLSIARSTLSLAISNLEQDLGAPLFTKNGSTFLLTPYGKEFYRYASLALKNIETGRERVQTMINSKVETLRIGVPFSIQNEDWSRMMRAFRAHIDQGTSVKVMQGFSATLLHDLAAGTLDVTFATKLDDAPDGLDYIPFWSQELVLAVNEDNPLAQCESITLEELQGKKVLSYAVGCPPHDQIMECTKHLDIEVEERFREEITACSIVSASEEVLALVDYSFLMKAFNDVICIPIEGLPRDFHKIYLIHRSDDVLTEAQRDFITFACNHHIPPAWLPRKGEEAEK